jgi:hypothetical protein
VRSINTGTGAVIFMKNSWDAFPLRIVSDDKLIAVCVVCYK